MDFILLFASYSLLGAGIKYVDDAFDEKNTFNKTIAYLIAPILGAVWAYTMIASIYSATILLAILLGVILTRKIDNHAHFIGLLIIMILILLMDIELMLPPLIALTLFSLLDEIGNDHIDKQNYLKQPQIQKRIVGHFFDQRWMTKLAVLVLVIINIFPMIFFFAIFLFDIAYLAVHRLSYSKKTLNPTPIVSS